MKVHYLEIVSHDVDSVCDAYEKTHAIHFQKPDALLGGARTSTLANGSIIGVRKPLRESEQPIIRPYWLVDDIAQAVVHVTTSGATIAVPPTDIPGKGKFAIYILGSNEHGLWQL